MTTKEYSTSTCGRQPRREPTKGTEMTAYTKQVSIIVLHYCLQGPSHIVVDSDHYSLRPSPIGLCSVLLFHTPLPTALDIPTPIPTAVATTRRATRIFMQSLCFWFIALMRQHPSLFLACFLLAIMVCFPGHTEQSLRGPLWQSPKDLRIPHSMSSSSLLAIGLTSLF